MTGFEPRNPDFAARVTASFVRQSFMGHIGAELARIEPGYCEVARAQVMRAGRLLTVCRADVYGVTGGDEKHCATGLVTLMRLPGRADEPEAA